MGLAHSEGNRTASIKLQLFGAGRLLTSLSNHCPNDRSRSSRTLRLVRGCSKEQNPSSQCLANQAPHGFRPARLAWLCGGKCVKLGELVQGRARALLAGHPRKRRITPLRRGLCLQSGEATSLSPGRRHAGSRRVNAIARTIGPSDRRMARSATRDPRPRTGFRPVVRQHGCNSADPAGRMLSPPSLLF